MSQAKGSQWGQTGNQVGKKELWEDSGKVRALETELRPWGWRKKLQKGWRVAGAGAAGL